MPRWSVTAFSMITIKLNRFAFCMMHRYYYWLLLIRLSSFEFSRYSFHPSISHKTHDVHIEKSSLVACLYFFQLNVAVCSKAVWFLNKCWSLYREVQLKYPKGSFPCHWDKIRRKGRYHY